MYLAWFILISISTFMVCSILVISILVCGKLFDIFHDRSNFEYSEVSPPEETFSISLPISDEEEKPRDEPPSYEYCLHKNLINNQSSKYFDPRVEGRKKVEGRSTSTLI